MKLKLGQQLNFKRAKLLQPGDRLKDKVAPCGIWTVASIDKDHIYFNVVENPVGSRSKNFPLSLSPMVSWRDFTVLSLGAVAATNITARISKPTRRASQTENQKLQALSHATLVRRVRNAGYRIDYLVATSEKLVNERASLRRQVEELRNSLTETLRMHDLLVANRSSRLQLLQERTDVVGRARRILNTSVLS